MERARRPEAEKAARLTSQFIENASALLKDKKPANMVLLRGFSKLPKILGQLGRTSSINVRVLLISVSLPLVMVSANL